MKFSVATSAGLASALLASSVSSATLSRTFSPFSCRAFTMHHDDAIVSLGAQRSQAHKETGNKGKMNKD